MRPEEDGFLPKVKGEWGEKFALIEKFLGRGRMVCRGTELGGPRRP